MHSFTSYFTPPTVWWEEWEMAAHQRRWRTYESALPINHNQGRPSVGTGEHTVRSTQVGAALDISFSPQINGSNRLPSWSTSHLNTPLLTNTVYTQCVADCTVLYFLHRWNMIHNVQTRRSSQLCLDHVWKGLPWLTLTAKKGWWEQYSVQIKVIHQIFIEDQNYYLQHFSKILNVEVRIMQNVWLYIPLGSFYKDH